MKDKSVWIAITVIAAIGAVLTGYTRASIEKREKTAYVDSADTDVLPEDEEEMASEGVSPLTGGPETFQARTDTYTERLKDLDAQIESFRTDGSDYSTYSATASTQVAYELWDGELSRIYDMLLTLLPDEEAVAHLEKEQGEWLNKRYELASKELGRQRREAERVSMVSGLVSITRDRAYELAGRADELSVEAAAHRGPYKEW